MRRFIVLLALALTLMVLLPGTSPADKPLRGQMELNFYPVMVPLHIGLTGDISGNMFFTNVGTGKRGNQEKYLAPTQVASKTALLRRRTWQSKLFPHHLWRR